MITLNGREIKPTMFPDKTSQVWHIFDSWANKDMADIVWKFEHEGELMHLAQLADLVRPTARIMVLDIPYLPYARQDKPVGDKETFALHSFARILNIMGFNQIIISDPHSKVAMELIRNSEAEYSERECVQTLNAVGSTAIFYPDSGAAKKYSRLYKHLNLEESYGQKVRDPDTGVIKSYEVFGPDVHDHSVMIIDDICDGGATFITAAKNLLREGAKEVNLFVTHGIFSKGTQVLRDAGISRIFTKEGEIK